MSMWDSNPYLSDDKQRYTNFCFVLYPDNDMHMIDLQYLKNFDQLYHIAYILHDKDLWTKEDEQENSNHVAGEHKKAHYHVLLNMKCSSTISGLQKHLKLEHVEHCDNVGYYLAYMLHRTPDCIAENKPIYNVDQLYCDKKFKAMLDNQNLYFIQLVEIGEYIRTSLDVKLDSVCRYCLNKDSTYIDAFDKYQYVIKAMIDERDRDSDREYRQNNPMSIIAYDSQAQFELENKVKLQKLMEKNAAKNICIR